MLLQFHPTLLSGLRRIQSEWGDTRLNNYILEHGYRWLMGFPDHRLFWSPPVFFPAPETAAYSDVLLGVAPIYWIWRLLGFAPDTAFQLWMLSIGTLNFASAYLLLSRGFRCRPTASAVGALVLSFAAVRTAQLMHPQLLASFYIAVAVLAVVELFRPEPQLRAGVTTVARRSAWVALGAGAIVAQLYTSFYYGWFLCFALVLAAGWALALPGTRRRFTITIRANAVALTTSAAAGALILAPLAMHYLRAEREVGARGFAVVESMLPRVQSWAYQGPGSWLYGWLAAHPIFRSLPAEHEQRLGLGFATIVCAAIGLWKARGRRDVQLTVLVSLTMALLATEWPGGVAPWHVVYALVPGASALRAVSRIGVALVLPAALGVALLIDGVTRLRRVPPSRTGELLRKRERRRRAALAIAIIAVVAAEQLQTPRSYDKNEGRARVARVANGIGAGCQAFLSTTIGGADDPWNYHVDAMWASMERSVPTVNGYSGNTPPNWTFYDIRVHTPDADSIVGDALARWAALWRIDPARLCRVRTAPG